VVGAGIAIFIQSNLVHQLRYKLHNSCSKNQAEQLPIVKALETIENSHINDNILRTLTVNTHSRITLPFLRKQKIAITSYKKSERKQVHVRNATGQSFSLG
jgi:ribonuclease HI